MNETLSEVLAAVEGRVAYLRAVPGPLDEPGWRNCEELSTEDIAEAIRARDGVDWPVAASLLAQSYAFKVGAISLAAYALGLPWPSPAAVDTAVLLAGGRASGLSLRSAQLGDPASPGALVTALFAGHLDPFSDLLRSTARLGARLVWGNVAASCAAAFRAVEGAAADRRDLVERAAVRRRAEAFFAVGPRLAGTGCFERVEGAGADGWFWTRTSCCLWFRVSGSATCDDCSLIPAPELADRRRAELAGASR
jgi:hypothetical protein